MWGDVQSFSVTEFIRSSDLGIFRSWWPKIVSPYSSGIVVENVGITTIKPNIASFDQLEATFELQVENISQT